MERRKPTLEEAEYLNRLERENKELRAAIKNFLEIGKRDLSNPKYDGYFEVFRQLAREK